MGILPKLAGHVKDYSGLLVDVSAGTLGLLGICITSLRSTINWAYF